MSARPSYPVAVSLILCLYGSGGTMPGSPDLRMSSSMRASSGGLPGSPGSTVALFKFGSGEQMKTTPAGEYLTAALMDFNPDQYDSPAAIADGANKLLMLVWLFIFYFLECITKGAVWRTDL